MSNIWIEYLEKKNTENIIEKKLLNNSVSQKYSSISPSAKRMYRSSSTDSGVISY